MKKTVLISALVFFIVASLVSGSLAIYQASIDNVGTGAFEAAKFVITSTKNGDLYSRSLNMAPGDAQSVTFTINNFNGDDVTETNMKLNIDVELNTGIAPISMKLYKGTGADKTEISSAANTSKDGNKTKINYDSINAVLLANQKASQTYTLEFTWPSSNDSSDTQYQGMSAAFSIKATGTQVLDTTDNSVK
ncbi:MAG: hypothetical protein VB118_02405 [Oscillospiraceae bacterium]|nr:hypothetical protein [Oscillospiraceae bacterium]